MADTTKSKQVAPTVSMRGARMFDHVVASLERPDSDVERVKLFGYDCLRASGKVFAKVDKGRLIMKLPKQRIESLMMAGHLEPYDGKRGEMKLWVVVDSIDDDLAVELAGEARNFASA